MHTEKVLAVKTALLHLPENNYVDDTDQIRSLQDVCRDNYLFLVRPDAEGDPSYKQLIPYVTIVCKNTVLTLERTAAQTESRLHDRISLGVGGHINPVDTGISFLETIARAMARELREELWLDTHAQPVLLGLINDDSNAVGSVHLGLHYILRVETRPHVRETDKMKAAWLTQAELEALRPRMETWSQILLPALQRADHL